MRDQRRLVCASQNFAGYLPNPILDYRDICQSVMLPVLRTCTQPLHGPRKNGKRKAHTPPCKGKKRLENNSKKLYGQFRDWFPNDRFTLAPAPIPLTDTSEPAPLRSAFTMCRSRHPTPPQLGSSATYCTWSTRPYPPGTTNGSSSWVSYVDVRAKKVF